jgi:copper chaperone CopZ
MRTMNTDQIRAESASKVYKVNEKLSEVAGVKAVHTSVPSQDFEAITKTLDNRVQHSQELIKMWAESMKKAGLRVRFPRFE